MGRYLVIFLIAAAVGYAVPVYFYRLGKRHERINSLMERYPMEDSRNE